MYEKAFKRIAFALMFAPAILLLPSRSFAQVTVIDMIPNTFSGETLPPMRIALAGACRESTRSPRQVIRNGDLESRNSLGLVGIPGIQGRQRRAREMPVVQTRSKGSPGGASGLGAAQVSISGKKRV